MSISQNPTLYLISSACIVGFSGGLRLYLAFLLAGLYPNVVLAVAAALIIYATYTLDRSLENKEDAVNLAEISHANKKLGIAVSAITAATGAFLFFSKNFYLAPLFPFIVGFLYSKGIPLGKKTIKLKGGCGVKNIVIGITWGGTIMLIVWSIGAVLPAVLIGLYFGMKLFINSTIFDMKDIRGDLAAGIRTLPVALGEYRLRMLLIAIFIIQHVIFLGAMVVGILTFQLPLLLVSFISSGITLALYNPAFETNEMWIKKKFRTIFIDGESTIAFILSTALPY